MHESTGGVGTKITMAAPLHKANRRLQLAVFLLLLLFTAFAAPSAARAATAPVEPASDDRGVYLLSEPGHLFWFGKTVNGGSAEINAKLTKDVDLSEGGSPSHWTPIGQYTSGDRKDNGYAGSFDGGGFTVSGYIVASANVAGAKENNTLPLAAGFFGLVGQKAEIRGLTVGGVVSVDISNDRTISAGGIAGYNYGTITDNINSGEVSASGGLVKYVGGIAGFNNDTITNCANNGTVSASGGSGKNSAGGIAGFDSKITDCANSGTVSASGGSGNDAGGIVGTSFAYTIANCTNSGDVSAFGDDTSSNSAGGIAGFNSNTITNCAHSGGTVSAFGGSSNSAGGISGYFYVKITNCANSGGTVTASGGSDNFAGGIAGISGGTITNNAHSGDVSASGGSNANHAGGIVGYNVTNNKVNISNSGWLVGNLEAIGGGDAPALTSYPGKAEDMTNYLSVSGDISVASPEIADISDLWPCAVSGKKTGVTAVSFDIDLKATDFSDKDNLKPLARSCVTGPLSFTVAVSGVPVTEVSLDLTELTLNIGESKKLTATVKPDDATYKAVTWTSADPAVASVDENGKVTALSAGTTVITARAGEKSATCTVTVAQPKTGGSSHGCAAGLGALSMLTLIPLWLRRKR